MSNKSHFGRSHWAFTCVLLVIGSLFIAPTSFAQDDVLDAIEAELRAEQDKKKAADKAAKNEEKYKANYASAKAKGDALLRSKKYSEAIASYEEAKKWGPLETYPDEQITKAKELLKKAEEEEKQAKADAEYRGIIAKADAFFKGQKYNEAIAAYENAASVKPEEAYPKDQIEEAKKLKTKQEEEQKRKAEAAELQAKFDDAMSEGDDLMKSKNYSAAVASYEKAAELKPGEAEPKARITNAKRLAEQAKKAEENAKTEALYKEQIAKADDFLKNNQFDEAISAYKEAQETKADSPYPKTKIAEAEKRKSDAAAAEVKAKYDAILAEADGLLKASEFDKAKLKYEEATHVMPHETYPKTKMKECDELKVSAQKANLKAQYDALVKEADELLKAEKFDEAISKYEEAETLQPHEQHPKTMITEAKNAKVAKAEAITQKQYDDLIIAGEVLLKATDYTAAIAKFEEAGKVIPHNTKHKELITESNKLIAAAGAAKVQEEFEKTLTEAEELIKKEEFDAGVVKLEEAHKILPTETRTAELIVEAKKLKELKEQATVTARFNEKVEEGEALLKEEKFDEAIEAFEAAIVISNKDHKPQALIEQATKLKAAKQKQVAESEYNELIAKGDAFLTEENFSEARVSYNQAKLVFPDGENTITAKLAQVDKLEKEKLEKEMAASAQKDKDEKYDALMTEASELKGSGDFSGAIVKVNSALLIYPDEKNAKKELADLEKLFAQAEEKRKEQEATEAANKEQAEKETRVNTLLSEADGLATAGDFAGAKGKANAALLIIPGYEAAEIKLKELDQKIIDEENRKKEELEAAELAAAQKAEQEAAEAEAAAQLAKENEAKALLAEADGMADAADFEGAKSKVNAALLVIPKYELAELKLKEFEQKKIDYEIKLKNEKEAAELAAANKAEQEAAAALAAEQKAKEEQVNALLGEADALVQSQDYSGAKEKVKAALLVMPKSELAKAKMTEIETAEEKAKRLAEEAAKQKEAEEKSAAEKKAKIEELTTSAVALKNKGELEEAKGKYEEVIQIDAENANAKNEIDALNILIAENLAKEKAKQEAAAKALEEQQRKEQALAFIAEGDKLLKKKDLQGAQLKYQSALKLEPENQIATSKLELVTAQLAEEEKERLALEEEERKRKEAQSAAEAEAEKQENITRLMTEADAAIAAKDFSTATTKLNAILGLDATHAMATSKLATVREKDELQKKQKAAEEKARKEKLEADALKKAEQDKNNQIRSYLSIGDRLSNNNQFDEAIENYAKIIDLDPENQEAASRIQKCKDLKKKEEEKRIMMAELKKQENIANNLREAKSSVIRRDYLSAEEKYNSVLDMEKENIKATEGLAEIQDKLDALKEEQAREAERQRLHAEKQAKIQVILDEGDDFYSGGQYDKAIEKYKMGLEIDAISPALKMAIHEALEMKERQRQIIVARLHHKPRPKPKGFQTEMLDDNQTERKDIKKFKNELGKKYPPGVTEESRKEHRKTIVTRIVVKESVGMEYNKVHHDWGGLYYFKNGVPVTSFIWQLETRDPSKVTN